MTPKTTAIAHGGEPHYESAPSSPPTSPRRNSNVPHQTRRRLQNCRSISSSRRGFGFVAGTVLRRSIFRYIVLLSILYVSGLITFLGPLSALLHAPLPGSIYRSHETFQQLWPEIESDNSSAIELSSVWRYKRKLKEQKPCPNTTIAQHSESPGPELYLIVNANGGLNQQRSSICNAVAVAGLLNATLVIPQFEFHSVWRDKSEFSDIYDEDHFISRLDGYVKVVRELPNELMERYNFNISNIANLKVPAWAPATYYLEQVYPVLREEWVIRISPFANRLAMKVPPHIQFLRCLANYEALRFSLPISLLAKKLVNRIKERSSCCGGNYVSVHLRFEEDMVAFSCCVYDGGEDEKIEMDRIRENGWRGKFNNTSRTISPGLNRVNGKCPMTPLEVGMMLRGMGFANNTPIYLASGEIYKAEQNLAPLRKLFPFIETKASLSTPDELSLFKGYSSRLAAVDYMVCLLSEVFVTTQGGNFPHFLMGHRRFLYNGHAKSIKPNKQKLVVLLQNTTIRWKTLRDELRVMLAESDHKGGSMVAGRAKRSHRKTSIYSNPFPECHCLSQSGNLRSKNFFNSLNRQFDP